MIEKNSELPEHFLKTIKSAKVKLFLVVSNCTVPRRSEHGHIINTVNMKNTK